MSASIQRIKFPELFFGFVAPIGAEIDGTLKAFKEYFQKREYQVIEIKVTDIFPIFESFLRPESPLVRVPIHSRYESYIAYGNQLRGKFGDDILASAAVGRIVRRRLRLNRSAEDAYSKTVYLLHQFKRKEEIDLLRSVYGRLFFQISIYSRRGARVDFLSSKFAHSTNSASSQNFRSKAEAIVQRDEDEVDEAHGQRVGKIFHDADMIISLDDVRSSQEEQVNRFCDLLFCANFISPTKKEYGLFIAKAAALRTLDLSRQVGAAIFSKNGEVISLGSNEVPKAGGGTYWPDDLVDDREFKRGYDSNDERKRELLGELVSLIKPNTKLGDLISEKSIRDSQFMDALEYGRIVHAEMSAISDAARTGRSTKGASLFCTTFPCHMCAKHIVAAGIEEVVFLEPYPKSLAFDLHSDSLDIEGSDRGKFKEYPSVKFHHFFGVTPRRYREFFERGKRKDKTGNFVQFGNGEAVPIADIKSPFYIQLEAIVVSNSSEILVNALNEADAVAAEQVQSNSQSRQRHQARTRPQKLVRTKRGGGRPKR